MNYLDRNEFNYAPSQEVVEALKNFDINKLCFYTRCLLYTSPSPRDRG